METIKENYEFISYIVKDVFEECKSMGWTKESSIGKVIYEVEVMLNEGEKLEKQIILFELCYLAAKENIRTFFEEQILKLKKNNGLNFFEQVEEMKEFKNSMEEKKKRIIKYEKNI